VKTSAPGSAGSVATMPSAIASKLPAADPKRRTEDSQGSPFNREHNDFSRIMISMKRIHPRREPCRKSRTGLFSSRVLKGTDKTAKHSLIWTAALTAAVCAVCYVGVWFGVALSPLLFNHSSPQAGIRTASTNRTGELLSGGKTFFYAFRYVLRSDAGEKPAVGEQDTNLLTLAQWWPSNFSGSTGSSNLSNYYGIPASPSWRASQARTSADG
jgi:hypothetical protein